MSKRFNRNNRTFTKSIFLSFLFVSTVIVSPAVGDNSTEADVKEKLSELGEEQLLMFYSPGDIMVTSSARKSQSMKRTSSAMYVITAEDIRRSGATDIAELLRMVPGMDVAHARSRNHTIGTRGLARMSSPQLQILLDGRPLYEPFFGGVSLAWQPIFLENIERIEVIRGSAGVTWGVNAMNGVVNIITKKASDTQGGLVHFRGGFGARRVHDGFVRYGGTNGPLAWRVTGGGFRNSGFGKTHDTHNEDPFRAPRFSGRAELTLSEDTTLTFSGGHQFTSLMSGTAAEYRRMQYLNLIWRKELDDQSSLQLRWGQSFYTDRKGNYDLYTREDLLELQHNFVSGVHSIVWGADFLHDTFDTAPEKINDLATPDSESNPQCSAFVEDEITLADNLWLTIGNRQYHGKLTGHDWAGRVSLVWEAAPEHFLRFAVSRSFRRPTFTELFWNSYNTSGVLTIVGNEDLRNERLVSYEIGYRGRIRENLELNVEGFYNQHKDLIGTQKVGVTDYFYNALDMVTYGIETSIDWQPVDWWRIKAFHCYEYQEDTDRLVNDDTYLRAWSPPKHKVGMTNYLQIDKTTNLSVQLFWSDTFYNNQRPPSKADPYMRLDIRLAKKLWNDSAEIAVGATNLQESRHYEAGKRTYNEVPRQVYMQFFCKF